MSKSLFAWLHRRGDHNTFRVIYDLREI